MVVLLILLIWNPERIWVGRRRWVRLKTISRNSCEVGTGWISFHVVFMVGNVRGVGGGWGFGRVIVKKGFWEKFCIFFHHRPLVANLIASRDLPHVQILAGGLVSRGVVCIFFYFSI